MKRLISISIIVGFLFSILLATGSFAADVITLKASYGNVTFNHEKHLEVAGNDCVKCQHTWKKGETSGKLCVEFHKEKAEEKHFQQRMLSTRSASCHKELPSSSPNLKSLLY